MHGVCRRIWAREVRVGNGPKGGEERVWAREVRVGYGQEGLG